MTASELAAICPACGCCAHHRAHAVMAALCVDDLDHALDLGLLNREPCTDCLPACNAQLTLAQTQRRAAIAARARYRARLARLEQRAAERAARTAAVHSHRASLPPAAAAALARARERAGRK